MDGMRNIGPVTEDILKSIGITSDAQLKKEDPVDVYVQMKLFGYNVSRNMLWALYGAINDCDWLDISDEDKIKLESQLEDVDSQKKKET